jgi:hypothetical protein
VSMYTYKIKVWQDTPIGPWNAMPYVSFENGSVLHPLTESGETMQSSCPAPCVSRNREIAVNNARACISRHQNRAAVEEAAARHLEMSTQWIEVD